MDQNKSQLRSGNKNNDSLIENQENASNIKQKNRQSMTYNNSSIFRESSQVNNSMIRRDQMNNSMLRRDSQLNSSMVRETVIVDDTKEFNLEKLQKKNITFISESEFKKENNCYICTIEFGNMIGRQHHCRLCANSVCDPCSMKRVNETRVCDLCFYKLKNLSGERRKKEFQKTMKTYINQVAKNIIKGQKDIEVLEKQIGERELDMNQKQMANNQEVQEKEEELQKLQQIFKKLQIDQENIEKEQAEQKDILKKIKQEFDTIDNEEKLQGQKVDQLQGTLDSKQTAYKVLKDQKIKIEKSDNFMKLPNYQKAKRYENIPLSEAIISLDQQYPPENTTYNTSGTR